MSRHLRVGQSLEDFQGSSVSNCVALCAFTRRVPQCVSTHVDAARDWSYAYQEELEAEQLKKF